MIRAKDLAVGRNDVLFTVNFTVEDGTFAGLKGPNGVGKTTLLRTLAGLLPPIGGSYETDGAAFVVQELLVDPRFPVTVREFVESTAKGDIRTALEATDVTHLERRAYPTLSGGEKKRVLIARALATGKRTLLLDEPTAGVDLENVGRIIALLRNLAQEGYAVLASSHDETLLASADTVVEVMR